jgi:SSS family solute:Na+ symporter
MLIRELLPVGYTGLIIAALVAAIVSSLNSMTNSAATIFTMDVYRKVVRPRASQPELVLAGRLASAAALTTAVCIAPTLTNLSQAFQFIQEYTGFVTPGVMTIFLFALIWKRTTSTAALSVALSTIPVSALLKYCLPQLGFLNRMGIVFLILSTMIVLVTLRSESGDSEQKHLVIRNASFKTTPLFNVLALTVLGTVAALYLYFW